MRTIFLCATVAPLLLFSCQRPKERVFEAVKADTDKAISIAIYDNYRYTMSLNDSLLEEGEVEIIGKKITLSPSPKSYLQTLIINHEFTITGNRLCGVSYEPRSTDTSQSELGDPVEITDKQNCFEIKQNLLKESRP